MNNEKEVVSNIVELNNGDRVDFGKNGKVISTYDVESGKITFKVASGEVIEFNIGEIPAEVLREAAIYGLREKIKATLSPIPLTVTEEEAAKGAITKAEKIEIEIKALRSGAFVTRTSESYVGLDNFLKALATVCAYGTILSAGNKPVEGISIKLDDLPVEELQPQWKDVANIETVAEVLNFWKNLSPQEKAAQKRNTWFKTQENLIDSGAVVL